MPKHLSDAQRWLCILLRSLHLAGIVLAAAAIFADSPYRTAAIALMLLSGFALYGMELWGGNQNWRELTGAFSLCKMLLVLVMALAPENYAIGLFWLLLIASSLVSHAPKHVRHKRLL